MNTIRSAMNYLFNKHLFATNVVACGGLLGLGDCIIQNMEYIHCKSVVGQEKPYDFGRTGRMIVIGLCLGPFNHHWYRLLDKYVVGSGIQVVAKKIAADQTVAGPFFCTVFLIASGLLEGKSFHQCQEEWRSKFLTLYMADWCLWPPAQTINFYFLPPRFRVLYVSMITLVWNTFLSFMKHREDHLAALEQHRVAAKQQESAEEKSDSS